MSVQIITHSLEQTRELGQKIGELIKTGMVITLTGEMGTGKTSFVQGLARGLEVPDGYYITSPTYTLINVYPGRVPLFHGDLYRLEGGSADFEDIGLYEILDDDQAVVAIEWADRLDNEALSDYISIHFEITDQDSRKIIISGTGSDEESLIEGLRVRSWD